MADDQVHPTVQREQQGGLVWLRWPLLAEFPELAHGIFTRHGGASLPPYDSLNLSFSVGDDPDRVRHNLALVKEAMGVEELLSVGQVHGTNTLIVTDKNRAAALRGTHGIDILMTDIPGIGLLIKQADCQAVALYDPDKRVIANIHCGWRGNVQNVIGQAVRQLREVFGSRPESLRAGISPSLGPCCAEFSNYQAEFPAKLWSYQVRPTYFDLWRLSREQLHRAGVPTAQIQLAGICSRCQEGDFFSYRRSKITGRNGTILALRLSGGK